MNEKCLNLGVGRRIRTTTGHFCRGTSVLAHLSISGYGPGRHKQLQNTHVPNGSVCVCWCSSEKDTLVKPRKKKKISRVTPLFSRLRSYQTTPARPRDSHILVSGFCQSPLSSQPAWMSAFTDSDAGHGVSFVLRNNCPENWAAGGDAELKGWLGTKKRGDDRTVWYESSPLNEQGLTSAAGLGDASTGVLGHLQSGKDLKDSGKNTRQAPHLYHAAFTGYLYLDFTNSKTHNSLVKTSFWVYIAFWCLEL